jgi:hypothetical protein
MVSKVLGFCRRARLGAAAIALAAACGLAHAQDEVVAEKSPFSVAMDISAQSHFISYGADVWGAGGKISPLSAESTVNTNMTVTLGISDELSVYLNTWTDINNNADDPLGANIQEIDVNIGGTYTVDKTYSFTLAHGVWIFGGDEERIIDFIFAYADGDKITKSADWSLNPSAVLHWRYDQGAAGGDEGFVLVPGIRPSFTFSKESKYPITLGVPVNLGLFTDDFHGGDGGYGFFSAGAVASIPLAFINDTGKYGTWTASAGATFWNTSDDVIPGNPEENFITTFVSVGLAF